MANSSGKKADELTALLSALRDEIDEEQHSVLNATDQRLDEVAREILRFERDMTVPGSPSSEGVRLERLMHFIEERDF